MDSSSYMYCTLQHIRWNIKARHLYCYCIAKCLRVEITNISKINFVNSTLILKASVNEHRKYYHRKCTCPCFYALWKAQLHRRPHDGYFNKLCSATNINNPSDQIFTKSKEFAHRKIYLLLGFNSKTFEKFWQKERAFLLWTAYKKM